MIAALAFFGFEFATAPTLGAVTPSPDAYLNHDSLTVSVPVSGADRLHDLSVRLDGHDVTPSVRLSADRLYFATGRLADGSHVVSFRAKSSNVLRPDVAKTWTFSVDTTAPTLVVETPGADAVVSKAPAQVAGATEPGATVVATAGGATATAVAGADGRFAVAPTVPDGQTTLRLTATDKAGNATDLTRRFLADAQPPRLTVTGLHKIVGTSSPHIQVIATDEAATPLLRLVLDGKQMISQRTQEQIEVPIDKLPEGLHTISITALDRGGHKAVSHKTFLVNSTEKLGKATLIAGARGKDVQALQRRLKKEGYYHGHITGVLDAKTVKGVKAMEADLGLTQDGIVGPMLLGGLAGRIVIVQHEHRLYFYLSGKLKKTYTVATGQPAYPTPNGTFSVVWMTKNPTWTPPDSPWAAGAKPVAPGPDNPVGMRWIGTSASGVGIHGVPSSENSSIGTYASHGCIRMYEWDVEDLYDWVQVGMPVIIEP